MHFLPVFSTNLLTQFFSYMYIFCFTESKVEFTSSSRKSPTKRRHESHQNYRHYNSCVFPVLCSCYRACSGGPSERKTCIAFIAWYSLYISSALNPIIYYPLARRCRSVFKQFLKDPFGSSDFKENPNGRVCERLKPTR